MQVFKYWDIPNGQQVAVRFHFDTNQDNLHVFLAEHTIHSIMGKKFPCLNTFPHLSTHQHCLVCDAAKQEMTTHTGRCPLWRIEEYYGVVTTNETPMPIVVYEPTFKQIARQFQSVMCGLTTLEECKRYEYVFVGHHNTIVNSFFRRIDDSLATLPDIDLSVHIPHLEQLDSDTVESLIKIHML